MNKPILLILFYYVTPEMVMEYEKENIAKHNADVYKWIDERKYEIEKLNKQVKYCNEQIDLLNDGFERKEYIQNRTTLKTQISEQNKNIKELKLLLK